MYRVALIDRDQNAIKTLSDQMDWDAHNCYLVGTACNALDGAALIRKLKPDVLFLDPLLPEGDGLAMLAQILQLGEEFAKMQVTVVTAGREFESAQEAVRLGVVRYLTKPAGGSVLEEALGAMTDRLDRMFPPEHASAEHPGFIVHQAISYMEQNYNVKLTLQDVANHCFVSQWHLSKLLNRQTEQSFYDLLNTIRIDRAKQLLQNPGLKIGDIVELVGFSDSAHFARVFKKLVGISANEYRNQLS